MRARSRGTVHESAWATDVSTLLAGPVLYGVIGFGIDRLAGSWIGLPIGAVVGLLLSLYIVRQRRSRV